jgi:SpoVK/Ycf46/Vps4 family AAA+-type ATPase
VCVHTASEDVPAEESREQSVAREALCLEVKVHLVVNERHPCRWVLQDVDQVFESMNRIWAPAGITFQPVTRFSPAATASLEAAFSTDLKNPPTPPRLSSCLALKAESSYQPSMLNLYLVDTLKTVGSPPRPAWTVPYSRHRLALFAATTCTPVEKIMAVTVGQLLGLLMDRNLSTDLLMHGNGPGTTLREEDIATARAAVLELQTASLGASGFVARGTQDVTVISPPQNDTLEAAIAELQALVGLQSVKDQLLTIANYTRIEQMRRERGGIRNPLVLYTTFAGPPGTGKSTVARLLARIYRSLGVLRRGHVVEASRSSLVGAQTVAQTNNVLQWAENGVLVIEDAPALNPNKKQPDANGKLCVATLVRWLEEHENLAVVLTGTAEEMNAFLDWHPALATRFRHRMEFPHFLPSELVEIYNLLRQSRGFKASAHFHRSLAESFERIGKKPPRTFTNARYVQHVFEESLERQANRLIHLSQPSDAELCTLEAEDVSKAGPRMRFSQVVGDETSSATISSPPDRDTLEAVMGELNAMVGLGEVKSQIRSLINYLSVQKKRRDEGLSATSITLHMVFSGPPGTGKTTVARLMGRIFRCLDLLPRGQVLETDRSGLIAAYLGQTALKVNEVVDQALDGVLFIDEAPALNQAVGLKVDYGQEAVSTLIKRMEDSKERLAVIVAGYPSAMQKFLDLNPGLRSRFPHTIEFQDYSPVELRQIFENHCAAGNYVLTEAARKKLTIQIKWLHSQKGPEFGNGRLIRNLFEQTLGRQSNRLARGLAGHPEADLSKLVDKDVPRLTGKPLQRPDSETGSSYTISDVPGNDSLEKVLAELDALIGLAEIKERIRSLINLIKVNQLRESDGLESSTVSMHLVFAGAPGTGKTTVARLMGRIYRCLGLLVRGHLVETDRSGLVSGYRGGTALKVNEVLDLSMNGVLFIDEAYALTEHADSSGLEAVSTLIKRVEDGRATLGVVLAGYTGEMQRFLKSNPGLRSRFQTPLQFADYTPEELMAIYERFCRKLKLELSPPARLKLRLLLADLHECRDANFGNGRLVRSLFETSLTRQANRLAVDGAGAGLSVLLEADVPEELTEKPARRIGFRQNA